MSKKYKKFEKKLLDNYIESVVTVQKFSSNKRL